MVLGNFPRIQILGNSCLIQLSTNYLSLFRLQVLNNRKHLTPVEIVLDLGPSSGSGPAAETAQVCPRREQRCPTSPTTTWSRGAKAPTQSPPSLPRTAKPSSFKTKNFKSSHSNPAKIKSSSKSSLNFKALQKLKLLFICGNRPTKL